MRRLIIILIALLPSLASAQEAAQARRAQGNWVPSDITACIGGSSCPERRLRIPLEDRPVLSVRFHAHDQIGTKADGQLRVKIDGNTVRDSIDIPRRGETFTIDVDELRGRYLVFEAASNDEVEIREVAVLYGRDTLRRVPRDRNDGGRNDRGPRGNGGWRAYPRAGGCIGGDGCRENGNRITIALEDAPVLGVRFSAHDNIGTRADGKLSVRIDDTQVGFYVDVKREGRRHEFDVDNVYGRRLVIQTENDDEVEVKDIEVLYGRRERPRDRDDRQREVRHEGSCIGGDACGGRRARIRIALNGNPVEKIRFYAHDEVGARAGGELRIRIDDEIVTYAMDIPREGRTFTIDGNNIAGDYLYFEPAEDDEIVIKDIRVTFWQGNDGD